MIVAIHQPNYLPWAGYFAKAAIADVLILLDDVQLPRGRSWTSRAKIAPAGREQWLSIPISRSADSKIADATIVDDGWVRKHRATITQRYAESRETLAKISEAIGADTSLARHNTALIEMVIGELGIECELRLASDLPPSGLSSSAMLAHLVAAVGGTTYLSGSGARAYHDDAPFDAAGIGVAWLRPPASATGLSIVHEIGTIGLEQTRQLVLSGGIAC